MEFFKYWGRKIADIEWLFDFLEDLEDGFVAAVEFLADVTESTFDFITDIFDWFFEKLGL